jgi:hypothetical protein
MKHKVVVCCWNSGHETELSLTKKQEEKLARQIPELKAVCPVCRNDEVGNMSIFIKEGQTLYDLSKVYQCRHGHVTTIGTFNNGMLHCKYGPGSEDFENIEGTIKELEILIDKKVISCNHVKENGKFCGCKLKPIDDHELSYRQVHGIRTKTRLGDLWDKAGIEPVTQGRHDKEGNYTATKTELANRERLKKIRKRNIKKHPGKRINKATKKIYQRRSKNSINID